MSHPIQRTCLAARHLADPIHRNYHPLVKEATQIDKHKATPMPLYITVPVRQVHSFFSKLFTTGCKM